MEALQKCNDNDAIVVVCLEGWHEVLKSYAKKFGISKLVSIVNGGKMGFESIRNDVLEVKRFYNEVKIKMLII